MAEEEIPMKSQNILPDHLVTDEVASFSRWTGRDVEGGLVDVMHDFQDPKSPHHKAAAECLHRIVENIKDYCIERGVTKYSHWFNSWTESPAYKRDNIEHLSPKTLFQGEPDASSKPSGGLRSTYEARGYTVWDSKAPLFILNDTTLCIPTLFISYKGEALDLKSPLLRAKSSLALAVKRFIDAVEPEKIDWSRTKVRVFAGPEQEYFLIPAGIAAERPDLLHCKATVMGNPPPRNQQLEEHYLGSISADVHDFFEDFNEELSKLGIVPATDHNEVAPRQFEFAPLHDEAARAADQNLLALHVLREVAAEHGWTALTHEKPFAGLNGSGKHLNFSVCLVDKDTGELIKNLHAPPDELEETLQFLVVLAATVVAIKRRARLLRASVATRSNDQRLGGNEAPPAVISVYLGETLRKATEAIIGNKQLAADNGGSNIDLALEGVPLVARDNTDRNRTSPIAFTGNKFEFRMPGSNSAVYLPMTILTASIAEALDEVAARVEKARSEGNITKVLRDVLEELMAEAESVIFDGDCYSDEWRQEAERRGLPESRDTATALTAFTDPEQQEFLAKYGVWSQHESSAFYRVKMDEYAKLTAIEASTMIEMVSTALKPAAIEHQTNLAERVSSLNEAQDVASKRKHGGAMALANQLDRAIEELEVFGKIVDQLDEGVRAASTIREQMLGFDDEPKRGAFAASDLVPALAKLREACDELERSLPTELYPFPNCGDLLYDVD